MKKIRFDNGPWISAENFKSPIAAILALMLSHGRGAQRYEYVWEFDL